MKLKRIPVVVKLYPKEVYKADLIEELKIDSHSLDKELMRQPATYVFWASLYSAVAAKVAYLQEKVDNLESELFLKYAREGERVTDVKFRVACNPLLRGLKSSLRRWSNSERNLKYGVRGFEQRKDVLQSLAANQRQEWNSEPVTKKRRHHEEEE